MKVKTERMKKGTALMLGFVMIAMVFAALPTGSAYPHYSESNDWNIYISQDSLGYDTFWGTTFPYYPGEQDISFTIRITNGAGGTDAANLESCNLYIETGTVRDENGNTVTSPISNWDVDRDEAGVTINNGNSYTFGPFQFDLAPDAQPGWYNLTIDLAFTDSDGTPSGTQHFTGYVLFQIVSNIHVYNVHPTLYAGQTFTPLYIQVDDAWESVHDLYLNLSNIPTGITFDNTVGYIPGNVETDTIGYRVDVARDMAPGIYTIDYQVQYYNDDDVWCTETGTLDIIVDFTPVIEAQLTGTNITVNQGDAAINALGVTFTNTGNVPLRNIDIYLDYDGTFFYTGTDYYEGEEGSGDQNPVQITEVHIDSLDIGATATGVWFVALNPYVQAGDHRILFHWEATYFDDGATNNPTNYVNVRMLWYDDDGNPSTPLIPSVYFDHGGGWGPRIWPWIEGPYVMVTVIDNNPDFSASKIENDDTGDDYFDLSNDELVNVHIFSTIHNYELVDFTDIRATLQVGPGTPFWNPLDHSATTVENDMVASDIDVAAGGDAEMYWYVDINPNTDPGTYLVNITLTGRNADTTEYITATMQAVVEVRGFGPELVVTGFTTGDIAPGDIFYLNLTIENMGDDTARDVFVAIPGHIGYNWNVIDGFISAISSSDNNKMVSVPNGRYYNESYYWPGWGYDNYEYIQDGSLNRTQSKNTEFNGVTLEQLNITDAKDIVDLALYIEGVFNSPTAEIWLMKADNLAPGQSITLSFKMKSNINMVEGRPYVIQIVTSYVDSYGDGPDMNLETQSITIRTTNPGVPYHTTPVTENAGKLTDQQLMILGIILLVILLIIVGIALAGRGGGKKKKHQPDSYEAAATPVEPAPEEIPSAYPEGAEPGPGYGVMEEEREEEIALEEKEEGESSF